MTARPPSVHGRQTFRALARSKQRAHSGPITVHFLPEHRLGAEVRVAYAISRKVGGAVVRNRCRRRLRAIAGEVSGELAPGAYLIGVGPTIGDLRFNELRERVIDTMRKVNRPSL